MKTKLKGHGGIKGLFLMHGEKLLIGAVALVSAYLAYSALGVERLSDQFQADKLKSEIQRTEASVTSDENNWTKVVRELPDKVKVDVPIKTESMAVKHEAYHSGRAVLSPPVLIPRTPRSDPAFLAAADVRATSGLNRFAFVDQDYMQQHEIRQREEAAKKEAEQKKQSSQDDEGGRKSGPGRRDDAGRAEDFDRDHPHRRRIEGGRRSGGVQLQGGELIEMSRWVSVVAKVPIKNQLQLYRNAFENKSGGGFDPESDFPLYRGYLVERAEVVPGLTTMQWQQVAVFDAKGTPTRRRIGGAMSNAENGSYYVLEEIAATQWARSDFGEVVNPRYLAPEGGLVYPLPPAVGREWGREATHPDIPLATDAAAGTSSSDASSVTPITPDRAQPGDPFGAGGQPTSFGGRGGGGRGESVDRGGRGQSSARGGGRGMSAARGRGQGNQDRGRGGDDAGRSSSRSAGTGTALSSDVDDYLLRFFDFTVEPGKLYSYRVRLVLIDPNAHLLGTPSVLDEAALKRLRAIPKDPRTGELTKTYQEAPWSEPSPPVGVPLDGRVQLASVVPGEEPKVSLLVDGFGRNPKGGGWLQASVTRDFTRGSVANFVDDAEYVTDEQTHIDRVDKFPFTTGVAVIDIRGGERLGGRNDLTVPARVLLMSPTGDLTIRQELNDAPAVQSHQATFAKPKPGDGRQQAEPAVPRR